MQVHPHAYECTIYEQTKGKFPKEPHVVWINGGLKGLLHSIQAREAMSVTVMGPQKWDIINLGKSSWLVK